MDLQSFLKQRMVTAYRYVINDHHWLYALGVGGIPVFSYFLGIFLNRLNIATLQINTENRIIEISKYRTVINQ